MNAARKRSSRRKPPIAYWSHSSLMAYLRNPLAWYKRYVKKIYDTPRTPASVVGSAAHVALEHFYLGASTQSSIEEGLQYLRSISDFEINFGTRASRKAQKAKRKSMEREYLQAVGFYLAKAPKYRKVLGVEVRGLAEVPGLPLPVKAISDLVVESSAVKGAVDIVDHKFVDSFSKNPDRKPLFLMQAIFNYYTVSELFERPVARFIAIECKKTRNSDGSPQLRRYVIPYKDIPEIFELFHRLVNDATDEITTRKSFLPNPSDMFEGDDSFEVYRLRLIEDDPAS